VRHRIRIYALGGCASACTIFGGDLDALTGSATGTPFDGGIGGETVIPGCAADRDPRDAPCQLDDRVGVFVSLLGNDDGPGSKAYPFRTITKALTAISTQRPRVYVCEGPYEDSMAVAKQTSIYGGFACSDWHSTGDKSAIVAPAGQFTVQVTRNFGATLLEDLELRSADAVDPGGSSIVAWLADSSPVTFRRVKLVASSGKDGAAATGAPVSNHATNLTGSGPGVGGLQAAAKVCTCGHYGSSRGGASSICSGSSTAEAGASTPPVMAPAGGGGTGGSETCTAGNPGTRGNARPGTVSTEIGSIDPARGWIPAGGALGADGNPGQGGGGGGCSYKFPLGSCGGSSGGCGGCGGAGGVGGAGGGASIALLVFKTTIGLYDSTLQTGNGGNGGNGGAGQIGQEGGGPGTPATGCSVPGCSGAKGGTGAGGSGGIGGTGGLSAGVVYMSSAAPLFNDVPIAAASDHPQISLGQGGTGGAGGVAGPAGTGGVAGNVGNKGAQGKRAAIVEVH
jgi:hypothetical protein